MCRSTVCIRRFLPGIKSFDWTSFSIPSTIPSFTLTPIAVLEEAVCCQSTVSFIGHYSVTSRVPRVLDCFSCIFHLFEVNNQLPGITGWRLIIFLLGKCVHRGSMYWKRDRIRCSWRRAFRKGRVVAKQRTNTRQLDQLPLPPCPPNGSLSSPRIPSSRLLVLKRSSISED